MDSATRTGKLGLSMGWPVHLCVVIWLDLGEDKLQVGQTLMQLIKWVSWEDLRWVWRLFLAWVGLFEVVEK